MISKFLSQLNYSLCNSEAIKQRLIFISLIMASCLSINPTMSNAETNDNQVHKNADSHQESKTLISNSIRDVAADDDNVWIATDRGVSRFSKKYNCWISYTKNDGLVSDNVYVVVSDGEEVWFGTDNGISRYKLAEDKPSIHYKSPIYLLDGEWITYREENGLISNKVNCIAIDSNYIWVGTDKGLSRFDKNINSWASRTEKDGLTTNFITAIAVEKDCVWIGTKAVREPHMDDWSWSEYKRRSGLNRYDKNTDSWNTYTPEEGLASGQVSTINFDNDTVWIGTQNEGISCYSKKDQSFVKSYSKGEILDTNSIKSILVDGNYIWIGTSNAGVYRYIKMTDTWRQFQRLKSEDGEDSLASNHVTSIAVSGDDVWFGTYNNGLSRYNKLTGKWTTYLKASYPADNDVRSITVRGNEVWVATTRGLSKYDTEKKQWTTYGVKDGLISEHITLVKALEDDVFIDMANGLARLNKKTGKWKFYMDFGTPSTFVTALKVCHCGVSRSTLLQSHQSKLKQTNLNNYLLIGTAGAGIFKLPLQGRKAHTKVRPYVTIDQLPDPLVTSIEFDGTNIWVGTPGGLLTFNMNGKKLRTYTEKNGLASNYVNVVLRDSDIIWVGRLGGLSRYDKVNSTWETFTSQDGLPSDNVKALALNDGKIWIGTPRGLAFLRKK